MPRCDTLCGVVDARRSNRPVTRRCLYIRVYIRVFIYIAESKEKTRIKPFAILHCRCVVLSVVLVGPLPFIRSRATALLPPAYSRDSPDAAEIDTDAGLRRGGAGGATAPRPRTAYTPALYVAARGASTYGAARSRSRGTFAGIVASPSEITCSSRAQEQLNNNNPVRPQSSRTRSDPGPVL